MHLRLLCMGVGSWECVFYLYFFCTKIQEHGVFFSSLFFCVFVYMVKFVAMRFCSFVFKIVEGFVCLFCLFASSFKNIVMSQLFASSTPSHSTPFQSNHEFNFALKIVKRDFCTKVMISVM
jgi:hypothetical protein